jgi:hypothetical protein
MNRRDFFKFIPFIFITPPVVNSMIQDDKLRSVYEWQKNTTVWKQTKWTDIKKGMVLRFGGDENIYIATTNSFPHDTGIYAVQSKLYRGKYYE